MADKILLVMTLADQEWQLDVNSMRLAEAVECERLTGWTRTQWWTALQEDRVLAVKWFYYLARKRAGDPIAWDAIDFDLADVSFDPADDPDAAVAPPPDLGVADGDEVPTGPAAVELLPVESA